MQNGKQSKASPCSSSKEQNSKCCNNLIEFACGACFLGISCPLSIVWNCVKLPCKIAWRTARYAINWGCCRSDEKVFAEYSSFSDIDLDDLPCQSLNISSSARTRCRIRGNRNVSSP
ncbi:hypothetical protein PTKIN_Ptkin05aG0133800 [Pterospermum kingtungense]